MKRFDLRSKKSQEELLYLNVNSDLFNHNRQVIDMVYDKINKEIGEEIVPKEVLIKLIHQIGADPYEYEVENSNYIINLGQFCQDYIIRIFRKASDIYWHEITPSSLRTKPYDEI